MVRFLAGRLCADNLVRGLVDQCQLRSSRIEHDHLIGGIQFVMANILRSDAASAPFLVMETIEDGIRIVIVKKILWGENRDIGVCRPRSRPSPSTVWTVAANDTKGGAGCRNCQATRQSKTARRRSTCTQRRPAPSATRTRCGRSVFHFSVLSNKAAFATFETVLDR